MALTPEDVVNKRFKTVKLREGYDQDEVDDFLDEVVVELRRLNQENERLRQQLATGAPVPALSVVDQLNERIEPGAEPVVAPVVEQALPVEEPAAATAAVPESAGEVEEEMGSTSLLVLARRLHEEHVREGLEQRDALIAEGHATAARLVSEAEIEKSAILSELETQRVVLQKRVDELRSFEAEYRRKIKTHLEELIRELNATGAGD